MRKTAKKFSVKVEEPNETVLQSDVSFSGIEEIRSEVPTGSRNKSSNSMNFRARSLSHWRPEDPAQDGAETPEIPLAFKIPAKKLVQTHDQKEKMAEYLKNYQISKKPAQTQEQKEKMAEYQKNYREANKERLAVQKKEHKKLRRRDVRSATRLEKAEAKRLVIEGVQQAKFEKSEAKRIAFENQVRAKAEAKQARREASKLREKEKGRIYYQKNKERCLERTKQWR